MYTYSQNSIIQLSTCEPELQELFYKVLLYFDNTIIEGFRGEQKQREYFLTGKSKLNWPNGKHNKAPSFAVDAAPFLNGKLSWNTYHCLYFAGSVTAIAETMGIKIRYGGDWDMDRVPITDQEWQDLVHFERVLC